MTMSYVNSYDVNAGTLTLKSDNSRPYANGAISFTGTGTLVLDDAFTVDVSTNIAAGVSTAPIKVDVGSADREWKVELPGTTGLIKYGSGTLTLKEVPAYTGDTYLEGGKLKIPTTWTGRVKTNVDGMSVRKSYEGDYTVYRLDKKRPMVFVIY